MPKLNTQLIELPANHLLDKFGSGMHALGSGSAAALCMADEHSLPSEQLCEVAML